MFVMTAVFDTISERASEGWSLLGQRVDRRHDEVERLFVEIEQPVGDLLARFDCPCHHRIIRHSFLQVKAYMGIRHQACSLESE
jgi:hypothetical protein